jgi:chromosome partitioning protein
LAIIAICAGKGGVGKTFGTLSLAVEFAKYYKLGPVLIVDLDASRNATVRSLDQVTFDGITATVADVFGTKGFNIEDAVYAANQEEYPGVYVAAGSPKMDEIDKLVSGRRGVEHILKKGLDGVKSKYKLILIDCPPTRGTAVASALVAADGILRPFSLDQNAIEGAQSVEALIADLLAEEIIEILPIDLGAYPSAVDKVNSLGTKSVLASAKQSFGNSLLDIHIPSSSHVREAIERDTTLQHQRNHPVAQAYQDLADYIIEKLQIK